MRIGPDVPDSVIRQTDDWSCSVRSSWAALWVRSELGGAPLFPYHEWQEIMRSYADSRVGLKDGSGEGLEQALRGVGIPAFNVHPATLDNVQTFLRQGNLVAIGGHSWGPAGHWALAVGVKDDGTLILENPAGCYPLGGTNICNQLLTSWSKSQWSAVVIPVPQAGPVPQEPEACSDLVQQVKNLKEEKAALESTLTLYHKELADARNLVGNAYNPDGEVRKALHALDNWLEANRS